MEDKYKEEVAICIAIQKIGQATILEIIEKLKEWSLDITQKKIRKYCKNLQKKGLISVNYSVGESGTSEIAYSMSKSIFARDIPIANYKDIVDSPEVKELIDELEGKKDASKGRKPDHCNYFICEVSWKVKDKVLGFMPFSSDPDLLMHYRDGEKIIFLPSHFRAYIGQNLRAINKSESMKNYIGYDYGTVNLDGKKLEKVEFSILDMRQGKGMRKYEVIPEGAIISTRFRIPSTDFKPEEFEDFLKNIGEFPIRGFGGRSSIYGRLQLIDFKVI